ncbi:hypothetical protein [Hallella sp.]|uniref:hypothetical protein n=1 Tax=Hallella sp. TaxID=2980186 RepID=UPI0030808158
MECLNELSGLFSLLAVVASVVAIVVAVVIYCKQKKDHLQDMKDELDAMEENSIFPMGLAERKYYGRKSYLKKKLGR